MLDHLAGHCRERTDLPGDGVAIRGMRHLRTGPRNAARGAGSLCGAQRSVHVDAGQLHAVKNYKITEKQASTTLNV